MVAGMGNNKMFQDSLMNLDFELAKDVIIEEGDSMQDSVVADVRVPCDYCGRKFNPDVSLKHVPICKRNYEKKHGPMRKNRKLGTL